MDVQEQADTVDIEASEKRPLGSSSLTYQAHHLLPKKIRML
jgi:hypothetical protein